MAFTPPQSRPFDARQRPRVGEWVHVPVSGTLPQAPRAAVAPAGDGRRFSAVYLALTVVALVLVLGIVLIARSAFRKPSPVQPTIDIQEVVAPPHIEGEPVVKFDHKVTSGANMTLWFTYSLGSTSGKLNASDPASLRLEGCTPGQKYLDGDKIRVSVNLKSSGSVQVTRLKLESGAVVDVTGDKVRFLYSVANTPTQSPSNSNRQSGRNASSKPTTQPHSSSGTSGGNGPTVKSPDQSGKPDDSGIHGGTKQKR